MTEEKVIFAELIAEKANQHSEGNILTFVSIDDKGEFCEEYRSYQQLWEQGQALAIAMDSLGMRQGDRFALLMQNCPEFVDAMTASSILGTVFVPIDPRIFGAKLNYMLNFSECCGVICADYCLDALIEIVADCPKLEWILVLSSSDNYSLPSVRLNIQRYDLSIKQAAGTMAMQVSDPDAVMQLLFTSGTTGEPKAIMSTYNRYYGVASLGPILGVTNQDRLYTGLSLTHANAQLITMGIGLKMGLPTVISRKFTKSRLWDICRHYDCTLFNLLGGMTTAIYSQKSVDNDADNPVRMVFSAGMPKDIWNEFSKRFALEIFEFYGAAEGGFTVNPPGVGPVGSIGKPPATLEAKILDDNDQECSANMQGEICFRNMDGSPIKLEYFKNPEESTRKTRGGWLRMGDICHKDEQGWLYFDYRKGAGIRKNGDFINIPFIEKVFAEHESVNDVFIYGIETEQSAPGEKEIVAAIVPDMNNGFHIQHLLSHCRINLEKNSVPKFIHLLDEIPKTASEKPQERYCFELLKSKVGEIYEADKLIDG